MSTLWSAWAPPTERSRLAGIANAGAQIGNVFELNNLFRKFSVNFSKLC